MLLCSGGMGASDGVGVGSDVSEVIFPFASEVTVPVSVEAVNAALSGALPSAAPLSEGAGEGVTSAEIGVTSVEESVGLLHGKSCSSSASVQTGSSISVVSVTTVESGSGVAASRGLSVVASGAYEGVGDGSV